MATTEGWASGKTSKRHSVVARSAVEVEMRRRLLVLLLLASRRYALPLGRRVRRPPPIVWPRSPMEPSSARQQPRGREKD